MLLVAYSTIDGQTRKIARFAADMLAATGFSVELLNVADAEGLDLDRFDAAVLAGPLHAGGYPKTFQRFVGERAAALTQIPTLFLAVSLSAAGTDADDWAGLRRCLAAFQTATGWLPRRIEHVAGAFRFSAYGIFRSWAMRRIARRKGQVIAPGTDKEYTDWAALTLALDQWVVTVPRRVTTGAASAGLSGSRAFRRPRRGNRGS